MSNSNRKGQKILKYMHFILMFLSKYTLVISRFLCYSMKSISFPFLSFAIFENVTFYDKRDDENSTEEDEIWERMVA